MEYLNSSIGFLNKNKMTNDSGANNELANVYRQQRSALDQSFE